MKLLHEDIRDSLEQAGQKACGYMNCKLFVQTVTGVPKLDELPSRPFRSIGDLTTGDVLKWGTGTHWAIYLGNGDIMEVEEWGAESRIIPFEEVVDEMDPPDMVFSTAVPQRETPLREYIRQDLEKAKKMKLLREYIIELLTESAIDPKIMSMIDKAEKMKLSLKMFPFGVSLHRRKKGTIPVASLNWDGDQIHGPCLKSIIVMNVYADEGLGPLIYDIAIEATGGLTPDREEVSSSARNVWAYYEKNRPDVSVEQLDDENNTLTPEEIDNCKQDSAIQDVGSDEFEKSPLSKVYKKSGTPVIDELRKRGMIRE